MAIIVPGYDVGRLLGRGSHGEVWQAVDTSGGGPVALKRIVLGDDNLIRAARAEAALLSALDHPGIISLREFVVTDRAVVLVLELAGGGSLAGLLRRRERLTPAEVAATLGPIGAALAYAHDEGVLHADVSAANVLFTEVGQPKLADLGVARLVGSDEAALGTPAYVDPVVAAGGAPGLATDVFSLAAVALHALTGAGPWQAPGVVTPAAPDLLAVAAAGVIADLPDRLAGLPDGMVRVLTRALDTDPRRRGGAAEFALDLRASVSATTIALTAGRVEPVGGGPWDEQRPPTACGEDEVADRADLTLLSRPVVRDLAADPTTRGRSVRDVLGTRWAGAGAVVLGAAVLVCALFLTGALSRSQSHASAAAPSASAGTPSATTTSGSALASPSATASSADDPLALLQALDERRSAAFAQRQPELLSKVYADAGLKAADSAQLRAVVPAGCQLRGLRSDYTGIETVRRAVAEIELRVTVSVASAELVCDGQPRGRTRPAAASRMDVVLTGTASGGFRIRSQRLI